MKLLALVTLAILLAPLAGCDTEDAAPKGADKQQPNTDPVTKGVASSAPKPSGEAKWKVTYSGALSGEIQGRTVIASGPLAVGRVSITSREKQGFEATFLDGDGDRSVKVNITLADGTECRSRTGPTPTGRITNDDPKAFAAEVSGVAYCGDKKIDFKGWFAK